MKLLKEDKKALQSIGWTVVGDDPIELKHKDGNTVFGDLTCRTILKSAIMEYEKLKKAESTKDLGLNK